MPTDDYILRSDALEHFGNYLPGYSIQKDDVIQGIKELPAADAEPVIHGRWVGMKQYCQHLFDITGERYIMSQLGISHPHCNKCWEENESRTEFCPHCGAKMDEKEEDHADTEI